MSKLVVRSAATPGPDGRLVAISPESAGWKYVGFDVYQLAMGGRVEHSTAARELCVVMLSGRADIACAGQECREVGSRVSVFASLPDAIYIQPRNSTTIWTKSGYKIKISRYPQAHDK